MTGWNQSSQSSIHTGLRPMAPSFKGALRFSQSRQRQLAVALDVSEGATCAMRMKDFSKEIAEGFMCSCAAERSGELRKMGEDVNLVKITSRFVSCFGESTVTRLLLAAMMRLKLQRFTTIMRLNLLDGLLKSTWFTIVAIALL